MSRDASIKNWLSRNAVFARLVMLSAVFLLMMLAALPAAAYAAEEAGYISQIEGRVDVLHTGASSAVPALLNDTIFLGDVIRTKTGGRVEIHFKDETTLRLAAGSRLKIDKYVFNPDKTRQTATVTLFRGKLRAAVSKASSVLPVSTNSATFTVNTPTAVAGVTGTVLFVSYDKGVAGVVFKEGHGFVFNANAPGNVVAVSAGQITFVTGGDAPPLEPRSATETELNQYVKDTTVGSGTTGGSSGGTSDGSSGAYGYSDTDIGNGGTPGGGTTDTGAGTPAPIITLYPDCCLTPETLPAPLTVYISGLPASITNISSANLVITSNYLATYTYILDGVGITTAVPSLSDILSLSELPEAVHTLTVTAQDADGNISAPFVYTWTTDYTPPVAAIVATPPALTNSSTPSFGFTANEPAAYYSYSLDGGATWVSTGPSLILSAVPEGGNAIQVKSTDLAGNTSVGFSSYSWTADYTPPAALTFTGTPAAITNVNSATIGATATDLTTVTYTYTLDGATSDGILTGLTEGAHTFVAIATDGAGNTANITYNWTTDYTPPAALALSGTPTVVNNVNSANVSATATDVNAITYGYTLDGATVPDGNIASLIEGAHTLTVIATDAAGNSSAPVSYQWFYGARQYYMTGSAVDATGASMLSEGLIGKLNLISTGTQGAWLLSPNGAYTTGTYTTSVVAGGTAYDGIGAFNGYWLDKMNFVYYFSGLQGTSSLSYLSATAYGTGAGSIVGGYIFYSWGSVLNATDTGLGTYTETPLDFSGNVWGGLLWYDPSLPGLRYANDSPSNNTPNVNGIIGLVGDLWTNGSAEAYLMGTYNTYSGAEPYLIYGSGWYMNYAPNVSGYSTALGGAFNGYNVGVWNNGVTKSNAVAIYIDPSGNAGYMRGGLDGAYYSGLGLWEMNGTVSTTSVETTTIAPVDLVANLVTGHYYPYGSRMSGDFQNGKLISSTYMEGSLKGLSGLNWGIWNGGMAGTYDTTNTYSYFQDVVGSTDFYYNGRWGYMRGSLNSADDWGYAGNTFTGDLSTRFMTTTLLGTMTSDGVYGQFDPVTGYWQSSMVGTWQATPLTHVSDINTGTYYLGDPYGYGYSYSVYDGSIDAYLGGTDSLWASASTPVTFMGGYAPASPAPHIWSQEFNSHNYLSNTDTTYDTTPGAYYGYITGTEVGGAMETLLYAMYVDPSGNVGYLKGNLNGTHYPSIGVFEQTGNIDKFEMAQNTGITAAGFQSNIFWGSGGDGALSGPSLFGSDRGLYAMTLVDPQTLIPQDWGLYYQEFQGQSANPAGNWTAKAGGNDGIGVVNPSAMNSGQYSYADNGTYYYRYNSTNTDGYQYYPRSLTGENYQTIYYANGTTWTDNFTGIGGPPAGAGTWNTAAGLSFLATPPDSLNATVNYTNVWVVGTDNYAYWLMDVTGQSWSGDKLAATTTGKFLGRYYMGTLTGDLAGIYDPASGAWSANGAGIYESTPLAFSGDNSFSYYYYDGWSVNTSGWDYGNFGATASPFADPAINGVGGTSVDLYLMGRDYRNNGLVTWWSTIEGSDYIDTTSHWFGWNAGITRPDDTMAGMMKALYIDANGNAGILTGDYTGATYPDLSMFEAQGLLTADQKAAAGVYDPARFWSYVSSANPDGYLYGQFAGNTGDISTGDSLQNIYYDETVAYWLVNPNTDEPWGIYKLELGGYYDNPSGETLFTMDVGGDYWKGNSNDYWIANISGNWNTDQTIDGTITGRYLTPYGLGDITGKMLGSYDTGYCVECSPWEGVALGGFTETPLAFSGVIDYAYDWPYGPYYGLYGDNGGFFDTKGNVDGLLGGVTSPWSGAPVDVVYMGTYSNTSLSQYIWNDDIYSYNANDDTATTFDNGAFYGFIGGVFKDKTVDARVISLYIDPDGNAGYIKGSLITGKLYPGLSNYNAMFEADGQWQATQMATAPGLSPVDLYTYNCDCRVTSLTDSTMTASISGAFGGGNGYIDGTNTGSYDSGYVSNLGWTRALPRQNWGIYDLIIHGYGDGSGSYNPNGDTIWSAKIGGSAVFGTTAVSGRADSGYYVGDITSGTWDLGLVSGVFNATFLSRTRMGTMSGDLLGYYDPSVYGSYDHWAATSLGTWDSVALAHSGQVTVDSNGAGFYAFDTTDSDCWNCLSMVGSSTGLMGGSASPWSGATDVLYVGTYSHAAGGSYGIGLPYLWTPEIYSYNVNDSTNTTIDGGMYKGFIGGVWKADMTIDANVYSLYIDPAGNAGVLKGNMTGAYYPSLSNMFAVDGQWTPTTLTTGLNAAIDTVDVVTMNYGYDITSSSRSNVSRVYVANSGNDMVSVIDATTDIVASTINMGFYPYGVVVNPRTGLVYVALQNSGYLSVFDANNANVANIPVGIAPKGVTVNPQANMAYVANSGDGTVSVIDTVSNTVVTTVSVGVDPREVAVNPLTNMAYVTNWTDNTVSVIDTVANTVVATISTGIGLNPKAVAVNPQTNTAYVTNWNSDTVSVIDTLTNTVLTTITVGGSPNDIAVNPQTNRAYVANFNANTVSVIDTFTNTVVATIPVGLAPREVAVDTQTNKVYVTDYSSGTLSVIDTTTDTVITNIGMGSGPEGVDAHTYDITVPYGTFNNGSGSITVAGNGSYSSAFAATDWRYSFAGQDWGIWKSILGGKYTGTPSDIWSLDTFVDLSAQGTVYGTHTADNTQWSNGVLKGTTYGYGADVTAAPKTWISVGDTFGTIDTGASTWQAIQTSAFIETSKFLAMADSTNPAYNPAALTQLNIPFVEVGRADLAGSGAMGDGAVNVNMNNVTFFAYSSGATPKIWTTGDVNGGYTCTTCGAANVALTGNGLNANFNVRTFDTVTTQKWMATVDGGGTYTGTGTMNNTSVQMTGAAAGTINTSAGTFAGTGSGTAH